MLSTPCRRDRRPARSSSHPQPDRPCKLTCSNEHRETSFTKFFKRHVTLILRDVAVKRLRPQRSKGGRDAPVDGDNDPQPGAAAQDAPTITSAPIEGETPCRWLAQRRGRQKGQGGMGAEAA